MGAEIGASFFNALTSLGQSGNRAQFRRAFGAATMNDIYNFLCYLVILPLELSTGVIERISSIFVEPLSGAKGSKFDTLNALTDPILRKIIQLDEETIAEVSANGTNSSSSAVGGPPLVFRCVDMNTSMPIVPCEISSVL